MPAKSKSANTFGTFLKTVEQNRSIRSAAVEGPDLARGVLKALDGQDLQLPDIAETIGQDALSLIPVLEEMSFAGLVNTVELNGEKAFHLTDAGKKTVAEG